MVLITERCLLHVFALTTYVVHLALTLHRDSGGLYPAPTPTMAVLNLSRTESQLPQAKQCSNLNRNMLA
jgi:hypothetical protein